MPAIACAETAVFLDSASQRLWRKSRNWSAPYTWTGYQQWSPARGESSLAVQQARDCQHIGTGVVPWLQPDLHRQARSRRCDPAARWRLRARSEPRRQSEILAARAATSRRARRRACQGKDRFAADQDHGEAPHLGTAWRGRWIDDQIAGVTRRTCLACSVRCWIGIRRCRRAWTGQASRKKRSVRWAAHESGGLKSLRRSDEGRCIQRRG